MGYRDQEEQDRIHRHQLWWSFTVAFAVGVAAIFQFGTPKSALLNQDRLPASTDPVRMEPIDPVTSASVMHPPFTP